MCLNKKRFMRWILGLLAVWHLSAAAGLPEIALTDAEKGWLANSTLLSLITS